MLFSGWIARRFHPRLIMATAGVLGPIAFWLSSLMPTFTLWVVMFNVTYSLVNGATYMTPIHHAWLWFPDKPGFASGVIMGVYGISGLIWNNVALALVNPEHISATEDGFYPESVNKRVPYMLQTLAYFYLGLVLLSIIFMFPGPDPTKDEKSKDNLQAITEVLVTPDEIGENELKSQKINRSTMMASALSGNHQTPENGL